MWAVPAFTRGEVDRAGRLLAQNGVAADPLVIGHALDLINNWRSSHSFPLNTFQMTLENRAASICERPIVARRLKRVPSIFAKLRRFPTMKLSQMQDIGGARAVLPGLTDVDALRDLYRHRMKHRFVGEKDYARNPKTSGYRSIHLVYRYRSDRKDTCNGLHIELQLRTRRQHAWATAVETVGTFLGQSLKSSEGREDWLRFFELVGSGFALAEGAPGGPNVPVAPAALVAEIRNAALRLQVKNKLEAFRRILVVTDVHREEMRGRNYLLLLVLRPEQESLELIVAAGSWMRPRTISRRKSASRARPATRCLSHRTRWIPCGRHFRTISSIPGRSLRSWMNCWPDRSCPGTGLGERPSSTTPGPAGRPAHRTRATPWPAVGRAGSCRDAARRRQSEFARAPRMIGPPAGIRPGRALSDR